MHEHVFPACVGSNAVFLLRMIPKEAGVPHDKNWGVQGPCFSWAGVGAFPVPSRPVGYLLEDFGNGLSGLANTRWLGGQMVFLFMWEAVQPVRPRTCDLDSVNPGRSLSTLFCSGRGGWGCTEGSPGPMHVGIGFKRNC